VRLLLDSHTLVWAVTGPEKLPARVREAISDGTNELILVNTGSDIPKYDVQVLWR
jgi:PIN domain nuclease of toxin-antitoxin system